MATELELVLRFEHGFDVPTQEELEALWDGVIVIEYWTEEL